MHHVDSAMTATSPGPVTAPDDASLVVSARGGDHGAFRTLVERHQRKIFRLALSMMRDPDAARDATQDAFVRAFEHLADFKGTGFYTWLYRIAMNLCIDRARHRKRFVDEELDETLPPEAMSPAGVGFDPARALADREIRERILAALDELSPPHRAVLVLREVEGMAYQEIADTMGSSLGTVMSRLFHARKRMQEMLRPLVEPNVNSIDNAAVKKERP